MTDVSTQRLLRELQRDSSRPVAELAETLGMSNSACHRRIRALEAEGIISGYSARLDPAKIGLKLQAFVEIRLSSQTREAMNAFEEVAMSLSEVLECHLLSGDGDYMLRVAARDLEHFDHLHRNSLSRLPGVSSMKTSFSIRRVKDWTGYPLAV